jgi:peroxiredoxin Q/BCP
MKTRALLFFALLLAGCPSKKSAPPAPAASATASASAAATSSGIQVGQPAPDFTKLTYDDQSVKLSEFKGRTVVLVFYAKDGAPDDTKELAGIRDAWKDIEATHAMVIGISADTDDAHKAFAKKNKIPFPLISDEDTDHGQKYGVKMTITDDLEEARTTFVIGPDGNVKKIYRDADVDVSQHATQILGDIKT